jgi:AraC family transcriptional regulator of adaptative response/methylated-DNA-[protein]-cysteine methyltransferase
VARASEFLATHADDRVTLGALAREVGVSAFHLQREFKRALGVSPREYQDAERRRRLTDRLRKGDTVSRATFEAGYGSSSRVYERASKSMGMTPAAVRKGGAGQKIQFSIVASPLGRLLAAYTEKGVCAVMIGDDDKALERELRADFPEAEIRAAGATIHEWISSIVASIDGAGDRSSSAIPIDAHGTAFQWRPLRERARRIRSRSSFRAIESSARTEPWADTVGDLSGRRSFSNWSEEPSQVFCCQRGAFKPCLSSSCP